MEDFSHTVSLLAALTENLSEDDVSVHDGLWDHAVRLWAAQREQEIRMAVADLTRTLFAHEPATGLLALYIVGNKVLQTSSDFPWLLEFNGALRRIADELVEVPPTPRPPT